MTDAQFRRELRRWRRELAALPVAELATVLAALTGALLTRRRPAGGEWVVGLVERKPAL